MYADVIDEIHATAAICLINEGRLEHKCHLVPQLQHALRPYMNPTPADIDYSHRKSQNPGPGGSMVSEEAVRPRSEPCGASRRRRRRRRRRVRRFERLKEKYAEKGYDLPDVIRMVDALLCIAAGSSIFPNENLREMIEARCTVDPKAYEVTFHPELITPMMQSKMNRHDPTPLETSWKTVAMLDSEFPRDIWQSAGLESGRSGRFAMAGDRVEVWAQLIKSDQAGHLDDSEYEDGIKYLSDVLCFWLHRWAA